MTDNISPNVTFLMRLRKIDKAHLTVRDVLILYTIIAKPGINGNDITKTIGMAERSSLQSCFARLERVGFIEDRRERWGKAVPTIFHPLPAGREFWADLISE